MVITRNEDSKNVQRGDFGSKNNIVGNLKKPLAWKLEVNGVNDEQIAEMTYRGITVSSYGDMERERVIG